MVQDSSLPGQIHSLTFQSPAVNITVPVASSSLTVVNQDSNAPYSAVVDDGNRGKLVERCMHLSNQTSVVVVEVNRHIQTQTQTVHSMAICIETTYIGIGR